MSDEVTRLRRQERIKKRNLVAKEMRENKGFHEKVVNPKKGEYKRVKFDPKKIIEEDDEWY